MATGNTLVNIHPTSFIAEVQGPATTGEYALTPVGNVKGVSFADGATGAVEAVVRLPSTASLGTGLTYKLLLGVDDNNNTPPGGTVKMGVNIALLGGSSYNTADTTNVGTEATGTLALPTTFGSGKTADLSIAQTAANVGTGVAADKYCVVRVRRLGTDSSDTYTGHVVLLGVTILDT